jgi:hypothetical protein
MRLTDIMTEVIETKESDGQGGSVVVSTITAPVDCRFSYDTTPDALTAYGTAGEKVAHVVTNRDLSYDAIYQFEDRNYTLRLKAKRGGLYYSTLVEIKGGE